MMIIIMITGGNYNYKCTSNLKLVNQIVFLIDWMIIAILTDSIKMIRMWSQVYTISRNQLSLNSQNHFWANPLDGETYSNQLTNKWF